MKTNYLTQRKEQELRSEERVQNDSRKLLEDGEKILYSETVENSGSTLVGTTTMFFLIFGFPFYVVLGFTALTAYLTEKTLAEFTQSIIWPAGALLAVAAVSLLLALAFQSAYRATLGGKDTKFIITNKRIFNHNPNVIMPIMFESRYSDVLYIYPERMGKQQYLQVRVKEWEETEDGKRLVENKHAFPVKNAQRAFNEIPDEVRWERCEKSKNGAFYEKKTKKETAFALAAAIAMIGFLTFVVSGLYSQATIKDLLHDGRKLFKQGQYLQAEKVYHDAYKQARLFAFWADFGPAAYRYAQVLETNGKLDEAIPMYQEAVANCNWKDSDSDFTCKPAVFRSNVRLAEIYLQKKNDVEAEKYFDRALETAMLETEEKKGLELFSNYQQFLNDHGKAGKAAMVKRLSVSYKVEKPAGRTFSD